MTAEPPYINFEGVAPSGVLPAAPPYIFFKREAPPVILPASPPVLKFMGTAGLKKGERLEVSAPSVRYKGESESAPLTVSKPYFDYVDDFDSGESWSLNSIGQKASFGAAPGVLPRLAIYPPMLSWPDTAGLIPDYRHVVPLNGVSLWFRVYCPTPKASPYADPKLCNDEDKNLGLDDNVNAWMRTSWTDVQDLVQSARIAAKTDKKIRSFVVVGYADTPRAGSLNQRLASARVDFALRLLGCAGVSDEEILAFESNPASTWVPQTDGRESQSLNRRVDIYLIEGRSRSAQPSQTDTKDSADEISTVNGCPNDIGVLSRGP